jgi:group I intron endonuclease
MIVYKVTNRWNGDSYIGQTVKSLEQRWYFHVWDALSESSANHSTYFHNAIRKYGPDCFEKEILHICESKEEMNFVETFYISFFDTKIPNGYNLTDGGEGLLGFVPSEETCKKLSESHKGHKHSEETKRKMSESAKGKNTWTKGFKHTEEVKKRMSEAKMGNKHALGCKRSEETRKKMGEAKKGNKYGSRKIEGKDKNE